MRNAIEGVFVIEEKPKTLDSVIKAAHTLLNAVDATRTLRRDTAPAVSTIDDYRRKQLLVDEATEEVTGNYSERLTVVMGDWAGSSQTFRAMRAALRHGAVDAVRGGVAMLESFRDEHDVMGLRFRVANDLLRDMVRLAETMLLTQETCLAAVGGKPRPARSKKLMLKRLPMGWRDGFLASVAKSEQYAMPCALLSACGLRPVELEKGVEMEMRGDRVHVRINGGKVRAHAGQPWRQFELTRDALPDWAYEKLEEARAMTVTAQPDALRAHLGRVSAELFPRHSPPRPNDILLSAYVFRHALVSDLRADGWETADIAALIGETSADTVRWYGLKWGTGGRRSFKAGAVSIVRESVKTARPVRPPSTQGLKPFKEAGKGLRGIKP